MAAFVGEVLRLADEAEVSDLNVKISDLSRLAYELKCKVNEEMESTYSSYLKMPTENEKFVDELGHLRDEMTFTVKRVETLIKNELESSTGELQALSMQLTEVGLMLGHVQRLVRIDAALQSASTAREAKDFPQAARHIHQLQALLDDIPSEDDSVQIYKAVSSEKRFEHECLLHELHEVWRCCLRWEEPSPDLESAACKKQCVRACLHVDASRLNQLEGAFIALSALGAFDYHLSKFSASLMRLVLQPLATLEGQVDVLSTEGSGKASLEVQTFPQSPQPSYKHVLANLRKVFGFIHQYLPQAIEEDTRKEEGITVTFGNRVGAAIGNDLCETLVKGCLADTVPAHGHDMSAFKQAASEAEAFHNELKRIGFLSADNKSLLQYAANIDTLFANKICELHLQTAREIARQDLHDTMDVGPLDIMEPLPHQDQVVNNGQPHITLSDYTFQFPKCQISKSAHRLLELLRELLAEARAGSEVSTGRLLMTARQAVELYQAVGQAHHQQMLDVIPQQVGLVLVQMLLLAKHVSGRAALFHNNCMYVAHHLLTLGLEQDARLCGLTFVDQVPGLRLLGGKVLLKCLQTVRQTLISTVRESGLAAIGEGSSLPPGTEKALRQCLRQLEILQTVWKPVLPENAYCKSIGWLLDALVQELVVRVVTLEDIPAHVAVELATALEGVAQRAPRVFPDPREVHRHVQEWYKLQALVKVLGASLLEIADHWACGAGPLAQAFTANELKQLVRALFQNNKRRAAVLAQIK